MAASNPSSTHSDQQRRERPELPLRAAALCSCELGTEPGLRGDILVLRVAGEIDMLTVPILGDALSAAASHQPCDFVVDLAGVGFCSVSGFALLVAAAKETQIAGGGFAVSGMFPNLDRIATLLWPQQLFVRYRSVAAAVTAIRVDQTYRST